LWGIASKANEIYKKITQRKNNKLYWNYTIHPGDTKISIIKKYCPDQGDCIESDLVIKSGDKINILLK